MLTVVASTLSGNFGGAGTGIFNTGEGARVEIGDTILMNSFLLGAVNIAKVGGEEGTMCVCVSLLKLVDDSRQVSGMGHGR